MVNYEQEILKSIINPNLNFETSKYVHEPYLSTNGVLQDDIWFYFYFYSDSGLTHNGGLNYEHVGLSLDENSKLTVNTSESFFRLDFYKIPILDDLSLDYLNKKLVFTKNLRLPLGEKIYFKPINEYVYVPIFHGSSIINEENMSFYWFDDDNVLSDQTLTGDTFYVSAKYFNSIDGSIYSFTKNDLTINDIPKESGDTYYKVTINKANKTYFITGSGRYGVSNNPIKFYSNNIPNKQYNTYKSALNVTISQSVCVIENDGYITIDVLDGEPYYNYKVYYNNILIKNENMESNTLTISELYGGSYKIIITDNKNRKFETTIILYSSTISATSTVTGSTGNFNDGIIKLNVTNFNKYYDIYINNILTTTKNKNEIIYINGLGNGVYEIKLKDSGCGEYIENINIPYIPYYEYNVEHIDGMLEEIYIPEYTYTIEFPQDGYQDEEINI